MATMWVFFPSGELTHQVCIFAYGQTGSGKSWTMEGGEGDNAGMIPRAIDMIFAVSTQLKDRGWKYQMEGTFLEVYNEVVSWETCP